MRAVFLSTQELFDLHWWSVASLIAEGVEQVADEYTVEDLAKMVDRGDALACLLLEDDGSPVLALVCRFVVYPRTQALHVMALGGSNFTQVAITFWRQFCAWAKESGATRIEACAAPAMTRVLRNLGFEHRYNFLRIEV